QVHAPGRTIEVAEVLMSGFDERSRWRFEAGDGLHAYRYQLHVPAYGVPPRVQPRTDARRGAGIVGREPTSSAPAGQRRTVSRCRGSSDIAGAHLDRQRWRHPAPATRDAARTQGADMFEMG